MSEIKTVSVPPPTLATGAGSPVERARELSFRTVKSPREVEKAVSGFEALLLQEMLKSMWSTVETTGFLGDDTNAAQIYRDMFNQAVADTAAKGRGIGVKEVVMRELERRGGKKQQNP